LKVAKMINKVNIKRAHDCLGHLSKDAICMIVAQLGMELSRTAFQTVKHVQLERQKSAKLPRKLREKATIFNGRVGHHLLKIRAPEGMKVTINKSNWHMMVDNSTGFKRSAFFETKNGIIEYMCQTMHFKALRGHPIQVLHQNNTGENVELVKTAKSKNWKLEFEVKYTARKTPRQNLHTET
jgi:hypothetical protein